MRIILTFLIFLSLSAEAKLFKVSNYGNILKDNAENFACIVDDKSGLAWEVKLNSSGLRNTKNTYTWFNGKSGVENGKYSHNCNWENNCNTSAYINALNKNKLCRFSDWRLPTESELKTLLIYGDDDPLINTNFFPNTQSKTYWSSQTTKDNPDIAIDVPFFYGGTQGSNKLFSAHIRAVRNAK